MTPQEAAACLRDDPTFATAPREEQEAEAALLLGSDDMLAVALAIELALAAPPAPAAAAGEDEREPCRLEHDCGGREPLAGNGRCMTCGAHRATPAPPEPPQPLPDRRAIKPGMEVRISARYKELTGCTDQQLATLIGKARGTVQAYTSGRINEVLSRQNLQDMSDEAEARLFLLSELKRDIDAALAAAD